MVIILCHKPSKKWHLALLSVLLSTPKVVTSSLLQSTGVHEAGEGGVQRLAVAVRLHATEIWVQLCES